MHKFLAWIILFLSLLAGALEILSGNTFYATIALYFGAFFYGVGRALRKKLVVLWLRSFKPLTPTIPIEGYLIYGARMPLVTLQSSQFRISMLNFVFSRPLIWTTLYLSLPILIYRLGDKSIQQFASYFQFESEASKAMITILVATPLAVILPRISKWVAATIGTQKITTSVQIEEFTSKLSRRREKGLTPGPMTLCADDSVWQQAVLRLIKVSDAIIVDVTVWTDNIAWELHAIRSEKCSNKTIIIATSDTAGIVRDCWLSLNENTDQHEALPSIVEYIQSAKEWSVVGPEIFNAGRKLLQILAEILRQNESPLIS